MYCNALRYIHYIDYQAILFKYFVILFDGEPVWAKHEHKPRPWEYVADPEYTFQLLHLVLLCQHMKIRNTNIEQYDAHLLSY